MLSESEKCLEASGVAHWKTLPCCIVKAHGSIHALLALDRLEPNAVECDRILCVHAHQLDKLLFRERLELGQCVFALMCDGILSFVLCRCMPLPCHSFFSFHAIPFKRRNRRGLVGHGGFFVQILLPVEHYSTAASSLRARSAA